MNKCPKCAGCLDQTDNEFRCLNCGCRPHQQTLRPHCIWVSCENAPESEDHYCTMHEKMRVRLSVRGKAAKAKMKREKGQSAGKT